MTHGTSSNTGSIFSRKRRLRRSQLEPENVLQKYPPTIQDEIRKLIRETVDYVFLLGRRKRDNIFSEELRFWTSFQAYAIYTFIGLSVVTREPRILFLASAVIITQILWIVFRWTLPIVDDRGITRAIKFGSEWITFGLVQASSTFQSQGASRWMMANAVMVSAPSGKMYFRFMLEAKMREAREAIIQAYDGNRFRKRPEIFHATLDQVEKRFRRAKT